MGGSPVFGGARLAIMRRFGPPASAWTQCEAGCRDQGSRRLKPHCWPARN